MKQIDPEEWADMMGAMRQVVRLSRECFEAALAEHFTEAQAMALTQTWLRATITAASGGGSAE